MLRRFVIISFGAVPFAMSLVLGVSSSAWASDGSGGNTNTNAGASVGGGQITVNAGVVSVTASTDLKGTTAKPVAAPNPYTCSYTVAALQIQHFLGPGGPEPGEWVVYACTGTAIDGAIPLEWIQTVAAANPVNTAALAQQAVSKLALASPTVEMAPPPGTAQLVNVASWLWIAPGLWDAKSASATAGTVTATATATPAKVVWNMGDGNQVTCDGPGVIYDLSTPNAATNCSYTWTEPSSGQPNGEFEVTATIYWQVSWTAVGALGGGNFGLLPGPITQVPVRVTESQAINTPSSSGN
jgi:hypothetical protein